MKQKNSFRNEIIAVSILLLGGGVYFGFRPTAVEVQRERREAELMQKAPLRSPASADTRPEPLMVAPVKEVDQFGAARNGDLLETLQEYKTLSRKVLPTETERARVQEILEDPGYLLSLKQQILGQGEMARNPENNMDAVKLLLEALRYGESMLAEAILQEIIRDPGVENAALPSADRERMAETKAEIMYIWSSRDILAASKISQALPGTVSQNIWRNVKSLQAQNEIESAKMAQSFAATGSHYNGGASEAE